LRSWREYIRTTFAGGSIRSQETHGEGAPPHGFTAAFGARIDLLFTMSDITRAPAKAGNARIDGLANEMAMSAPSGGARRDRTDDLLLAKQALSQLSYGPLRDGQQGSEISSKRTLMPDI
jgi:hypothetical protein